MKYNDSSLDKEFLDSRLDYDPETGIFRWKVAKGGKRVGDEAGSVNDQGYILIRLNCKLYRAHRLAWIMMNGVAPENEIDHIDGDRSNNRFSNLRDVERLENKRNVGVVINNTSGYTGVMWYKAGQKWHAQITIEGERIHLGYFDNLEDAINARKRAEEIYGFHENHGKRDSWNKFQKTFDNP